MNVNVARSNAMARIRAIDVETYLWLVSMRRTAAAVASRILSTRATFWIDDVTDNGDSEFRSMSAQIQALQEQVNDLYSHISALRGIHVSYPGPTDLGQNEASASYRSDVSPSRSRGAHTQFQGPTSSAYNFDVAKSSLQTMGIAEPDMPEEGGGVDIDPALGAPHQQQAPMAPMVTQGYKDPLFQLKKDEAIRLCKVYDEEMGIMYPMLDMEKLIPRTALLFDFVESALRTGLINPAMPGEDRVRGHEADIIRMVLATALTVEGHGQSELGKAICKSCREAFEGIVSEPADVKGLILLVLVVSEMWLTNDA